MRTVYAGCPATSVGSRRRDWRGCQVGDRFFDLATVGTSWAAGEAVARLSGPAGREEAARRRIAVERVRRGVIQRERVPVVEDLGVTLFGLQLQPDTAVLGDPQPAGCAGDQRVRGELAGRAAPVAQAGAFKEMVGELDVRADAFGRRAAERVVNRVGQRLGGGVGPESTAKASAVADSRWRPRAHTGAAGARGGGGGGCSGAVGPAPQGFRRADPL